MRRGAKFDWAVTQIPYWDDVKGAPQNAIIGGASLWVMGGKTNNAYKGVAKFFAFLSRPEVQMEWHKDTGYVPITYAAYEMTKKSGFYDKNPGADVAIKMLTNKPPTANSKGLRFGNYVQGREVIEEEMEGRVRRQEGAEGRARRGGEARQRDPAQVRSREQELSCDRRGPAAAPFPSRHGKDASSSSRRGCPTRWSRRRSRSRSIFFFWPAAQAVYWSFLVQDPFGLSTKFVWFQNYAGALQELALPRLVQGHRDLQRAGGRRAAS